MCRLMSPRSDASPSDSDDVYPPPVHDGGKPSSDDPAQRIEDAKEAARRRRRELGLPDLPPDELAIPPRGKRPGKRRKNHGQFMQWGGHLNGDLAPALLRTAGFPPS